MINNKKAVNLAEFKIKNGITKQKAKFIVQQRLEKIDRLIRMRSANGKWAGVIQLLDTNKVLLDMTVKAIEDKGFTVSHELKRGWLGESIVLFVKWGRKIMYVIKGIIVSAMLGAPQTGTTTVSGVTNVNVDILEMRSVKHIGLMCKPVGLSCVREHEINLIMKNLLLEQLAKKDGKNI